MAKTPNKSSTVSERTRYVQKRVLQLRRDGVSFPDIAEELGMTQGYIYKVYKKALREIIVEDVEDLRKLELEKLESLEQEVMKVLKSFHPFISSGQVVRDVLEDEDGNPIVDPLTGNIVTERLLDHGPKLAAVDRAVKLMERRARLMGLDTPVKMQQEVRVTTEGPDLSHISVTELEEIKKKLYDPSAK